jgi:putative tryptophan/tyrosine transport system substrate-binding protein
MVHCHDHEGMMKRRDFITLVGGLAASSPFAACAQQLANSRHVVFIAPASLSDDYRTTFRDELRLLGYIEGRNLRVEYRDAGGFVDQLPALAREIVQDRSVEVIVAVTAPAAVAAHRAAPGIPIVAFVASDPIALGLAASLSQPGENITGVAFFAEETTVKRVEFIREAAPLAMRLGTIATKVGQTPQILASTQEAARKLGFAAEIINIDDPSDIAATLTADRLANFDALVVPPDAVLAGHMAEVIKLVGLSKKPAIYPSPDWTENGGLMAFGPDFQEAGRHVILQLDRVLKGKNASDLPFDRSTNFFLSINLRTARTIGIELPAALVAQADKVIE